MKIFLIGILLNLGLFTGSFAYEVPIIDKVSIIQNNGKGEFFIYGNFFGNDLKDIRVKLLSFEKLKKGEKSKIIPITGVYSSLINGEIKSTYKDSYIFVEKRVKDLEGEDKWVKSKRIKFFLNLPKIEKAEYIETGKFGGLKITGKSFKKPSYALIGTKKIICKEETENTCIIDFKKDDVFKGLIGIQSFGTSVFTDNHNFEIKKNIKIFVNGYSSNSFSFNVEGYNYEQLRATPKTKKEENASSSFLNPLVKINIDGQNMGKCKVYLSSEIICEIDKEINYKGVGYLEVFGAKSALFTYKIGDALRLNKITYEKKFSSWTSGLETIQGNLINVKIGITNFDYQNKNDLKIIFGGSEFSLLKNNVQISRKSISFSLKNLDKIKGNVYASIGKIKSKKILFNFGEFIPKIFTIDSLGENKFSIKGKHLTNFKNQEAIVRFGKKTINTAAKKLYIKNEIAKLKANISDVELKIKNNNYDGNANLRDIILKYKSRIHDLENGIVGTIGKENEEGAILRKADSEIIFQIFADKLGNNVEKGEYFISVSSNGHSSNLINFFYEGEKSKGFAYPKIDKIDFINGAGMPNNLILHGEIFNFVKEIYFGDTKVKILSKSENNMLLEIPASISHTKGPITAKLNGGGITNTLFIYEFLEKKLNKIKIDWSIPGKAKENEKPENNIGFNLINLYKDIVLKELKIKIKAKRNRNIPFYNINLKYKGLTLPGIYDAEKENITFENSDFEKIIKVSSDETEKLELTFENTDRGEGDFNLKIESISFYDEIKLPAFIGRQKILFTKDPFFYSVKTDYKKFCIKDRGDGKFDLCSASWSEEKEIENVYEDFQISSEFVSPAQKVDKDFYFKDIQKGIWYEKYVKDLFLRGIVSGYKDGTFNAIKNITRAEGIKMLLKTRNETIENKLYFKFAFKDVPEKHWAKNILEYAVRNGFLKATTNFSPNKYLTRGESAKLLIRFFGRSVREYKESSFSDLEGHWARDYVEYLYKNKIVSGVGDTGKFKPNGEITRSEFSKIISAGINLWSK